MEKKALVISMYRYCKVRKSRADYAGPCVFFIVSGQLKNMVLSGVCVNPGMDLCRRFLLPVIRRKMQVEGPVGCYRKLCLLYGKTLCEDVPYHF